MKCQRIVHFISSLQRGGAEMVLTSLLEVSDKKHFEHYVIYIHDGPLRKTIESMGHTTYSVRGKIYPYDFFFFLKLWRLLQQLQLYTHSQPGWDLLYLRYAASNYSELSIHCNLHQIRHASAMEPIRLQHDSTQRE